MGMDKDEIKRMEKENEEKTTKILIEMKNSKVVAEEQFLPYVFNL